MIITHHSFSCYFRSKNTAHLTKVWGTDLKWNENNWLHETTSYTNINKINQQEETLLELIMSSSKTSDVPWLETHMITTLGFNCILIGSYSCLRLLMYKPDVHTTLLVLRKVQLKKFVLWKCLSITLHHAMGCYIICTLSPYTSSFLTFLTWNKGSEQRSSNRGKK